MNNYIIPFLNNKIPFTMENMIVKNKRMKMSPGGIVTLTTAARKALGMKLNESTQVEVLTENNSIILRGQAKPGAQTSRVSKGGQLLLNGDARQLLLNTPTRHYWLELNDSKQEARLLPF